MLLRLQLLCCYCYSDIDFCYSWYYERVIASTRVRTNCYAATATANEFATIATAIAYADASVACVAVLTAVIVRMLVLHI